MSAVMNYAMKTEKTLFEGERLVSGLNCSPQTVYHEFINTKLYHGKDSGRMYYHMVQSFPKGEDVPPKIAHEMAVKLAEYFKDYEVLICTHTDRDHIHSHFIINSVAFDSGRKFHISTPEIEPIRQLNDRLCMEYGFEVYKPKPKHEHSKSMSVAEYHAAAKGESWKMRLMNTIDECMKYAVSKEQFIELMEFEGYGVKWTDTRKNITYTTPKGMKCRDDRLHESKYLKERMELELRIRQEIIAGGTQTAEQTTVTPKADAHSFSSDTGEVGQSVLQPKPHLGWDRGFAEPDESLAATNQQHQNADEQPAHEDGTGAIEQEFVQDTADLITGWEQERVFLFSAQAEIAEVGMDIGNDLGGVGIANLGSDFVKLGKSLEQANQHVPVRDSTTQKVVHERKKGVGQKQDDHSGYDFEMKM
ncbi:relaxase/mobilization nuclease domain-containing protein [Tissierella carlieri]|uniref:relaxase/mobilization nuclease domain-containing protein n=2 Tax=Bacillota TaxID=1239 RepID=UPI001C1196E0|nr:MULTISPECIES: relaxase/mobilization nuclease domain-containing protein [Bacillota]MBU5311551.1 relaxase/mobilization nuclease domain-containing protein [Tissierella carlieri]